MVVALEVAQKDIEKWLDFKKVSPSKREKLKENIDVLIEAVTMGDLVVTEKLELEQTLKFPLVGESETVTKFTYKPRIDVAQVGEKIKGVSPKDLKGFSFAYTSALTGNPMALCKKMDTEDSSIADKIVEFFL